MLAFACSQPQQAAAYPCGDGAPTAVPPRTLANVVPDKCRVPETLRRTEAPVARKKKKGSISGLTVFVLAVAGALLIPIGRNGLPRGGNPYGHDHPTSEAKF